MSLANLTNNTIYDPCGIPTLPSYAAQVAFLFVILIVTIIGNFVVFMTVILTHSLRVFTNFLVASLAVSDLLVGSISLPFRIHQTIHNTKWCLSVGACRFWICADLFCCCASVGNLSLISIDRFLATKYPMNYHEILSKKTQVIMISIVWLYAIIVASVGLKSWTFPNLPAVQINDACFKNDPYFYTFAACVGFFLPLTVVLVAYSYVFRVSVSHWRAIRRLTVPSIDLNQTSQRRALTREIKAAKTLAVVVGAFVVCWAPFFIILLARFWCTTCFQSNNNSTLSGFYTFVNIAFIYTLPNINSTLNPFIYVIFSRKLRQAFIRLFNDIVNRIRGNNDEIALTGRGHDNNGCPTNHASEATIDGVQTVGISPL
ncbi:octopamine receptor-like [Exaiptasia diaphana]|uniref:G-protein coupled receptors family 1 profile domain-containing protein n=1 Tax=Exaiptasia diaphana TaxID=2652724 RepID=A0A913YXB3_EXADI|nr:octopamine receptor-like [Exaiptasia diaphana]